MTTFAPITAGVIEVANASDRAARIPSPRTGQKCYRVDTGDIERWTGTAWVPALNTLPSFPVTRFGGKVDGATDDYQAWGEAIAAAGATSRGGIITAPAGASLVSQVVALIASAGKSVILRGGAGHRGTQLYGTSSGMTVLRIGPATPDNSGTDTNSVSYCGVDGVSVVGSLLPSANAIGMSVNQAQHCWFKRQIVEAMPAASKGIYLHGSITGGLGLPAAPHTWRCTFEDVIATTTKRPWVIENADECLFTNCDGGVLTGQSSGPLYAWEILQGHNNRWVSCLASGDTTTPDGGSTYTYRANYRGWGFRTPSVGDNIGASFDGCVAEGFEHALWVEGSLVSDIDFDRGINASICHFKFNNGSDNGGAERGNRVNVAFSGSEHVRIMSSRLPATEPLTFTASDVTPSVKGSNVFACAATGSGPITNFDDGITGQPIYVRLTASYGITHDATKIICPSGVDIAGADFKWVHLLLLGTVWQVISVVTDHA